MEPIIRKIENLNKISRKRWLSRFPEHFPDEVWNGHWEREEILIKRELEKVPNLKEKIQKANIKTYVCSQNRHTELWGLDDTNTPEGGGVIAQSKTKEGCLKKAQEIYGINLIFISY